MHQPVEVQEQTVQTEVRVQTDTQTQTEAGAQTVGEAVPENNPEPKPTAEKGGGATESKKDDSKEDEKGSGKDDKKEKKVIRKTIAIEEDVFMQLQLLKVYYRLDHQDVIAIAVKEFLKRHTADGRIKDADLNSVMKMVKELKK